MNEALKLWHECQAEAEALMGGRRAELARPAFTARQRQVERLGDQAISLAGQPIPREALRAAILAADSPADLADRLAVLLADRLDRDQFAAVLEQALFAADVLGYIHAADRPG